jgi:lipoprotein NlpD
MMMSGAIRILVLILLARIAAGCVEHRGVVTDIHLADKEASTARSRPEVSEQSKSLREPESPFRTVVPGDTLYSIAWETGKDYRDLASWNRIELPYTIKVGQQIRLTPPAKSEKGPSSAPRHRSVAKGKSTPRTPGVTPAPPAGVRDASPLAKSAPQQSHDRTERATGGRKDAGKPAGSARAASERSSGRGKSGFWAWPADGKIQSRYSESDTKGVDITGARGQSVHAAAGGRVVYQGSGLRGYGQLIIIKHSDEFLSAYAHNDRIYVKEGDVVKRGQKIADMGSTGTDRVKLHFEIRRHGVPVDPLKYLPTR